MEFKDKFIEKYSKLTDIKEFKKYSLERLRKSIKVNTLKISINKLKSRLKDYKLKQIPWCKYGFFVESGPRTDLGNLKEHSLGYFYVQEAASMLPALILNPGKDEIVLDIAAAPGSKTTQIAALMKNTGLIVANDVKYDRLKALASNLERCGVTNTIITLMYGQTIKEQKFDKILVDAPCSGTGVIRKSLQTLKTWNPNMLKKLAGEQKSLLKNSINLLKENGSLVYSTCSVAPEENEAVINWLLNQQENVKLEKINVKGLKTSEPILNYGKEAYSKEIKKCLRIWPQDNNTAGFFIAKIKKV